MASLEISELQSHVITQRREVWNAWEPSLLAVSVVGPSWPLAVVAVVLMVSLVEIIIKLC